MLGALLTTQAAARHLGAGSSIINIGSGSSGVTPPNTAVYTATKGALDAMTGVLARELGAKNIRVSSVDPGPVETEGAHSAGVIGSGFEKELIRQTPLGRTGQPDDIARIVTFLASEDAKWLAGALIVASGGLRQESTHRDPRISDGRHAAIDEQLLPIHEA